MKLTGSQIVLESLLKEGVEVIFGLPGGAILPLYQTLPQYPQLRHILVRHEQGAAHAADGYARATGRVGVAFATSGPGATNLVTGIGCAQMDSVPIVCITGQVARAAIGKDAFQETDVTGITLPITKHNYLVMHASELAQTIKEAFYIARTGRPGPVLVDIPKDVQTEMADFDYPDKVDLPGYKPVREGHPTQIKKAAKLIKESQRPIILAGHGIILSRAYEELKALAEKAQIPVITTLLGLSSLPSGHVLNLGMPGMHGVAWASLAIDQADLLIGLGMRFDDRVTGNLKKFAPNAKIIHVDVDPSEISKNVPATVPVVGDVKAVLTQLLEEVEPATHLEWLQQTEELKRQHPSLRLKDDEKLRATYIVHQLWEATRDRETVIVTGVGQHQMWAAQHYSFKWPNTMLTSGGSGTMGYEVPAAMGAQVGRPETLVWSIAGDGGFQMTLHELATIVEEKIPVKFAIFNNGFHGMVRQWQDMFYKKSYVATRFFSPDFVKIADAYGMLGIKVTEKSQVAGAIQRAMEDPGPAIVDFHVEPEENVYPMIPAGQSTAELMEDPELVEDEAPWRR